jgi:tRNA (guanine10-N2)-methyltransferase
MTKVGTDKDYSNSSISEEHLKSHIPEKVDYSLDRILADLLSFAAKQLTLGGRLVFWLPVIRQNYKVRQVETLRLE